MPKPFPIPFNIGNDICSIPRIYKLLRYRNPTNFVNRILTHREQLDFAHKLRGLPLYYAASLDVLLLRWKAEKIGDDSLSSMYGPSMGISEVAGRFNEKRGREGFEKQEGIGSSEFDEWTELDRERRFTDLLGRYNLTALVSDLNYEPSASLALSSEPQLENLAKANSESKMMKELEPIVLDNFKEAKRKIYNIATFVAGRFAAKEAIQKAYRQRRLTYHDIVILNPPNVRFKSVSKGSKAPLAVVLPPSGEYEDGQEVQLSISHDMEYATAVCIAPALSIDLESPDYKSGRSTGFHLGENESSDTKSNAPSPDTQVEDSKGLEHDLKTTWYGARQLMDYFLHRKKVENPTEVNASSSNNQAKASQDLKPRNLDVDDIIEIGRLGLANAKERNAQVDELERSNRNRINMSEGVLKSTEELASVVEIGNDNLKPLVRWTIGTQGLTEEGRKIARERERGPITREFLSESRYEMKPHEETKRHRELVAKVAAARLLYSLENPVSPKNGGLVGNEVASATRLLRALEKEF